MFSLKDKVVLITGGYGYLGKSITKGLADHGAHVIVLGREKEKFQAAFPQSNSNIYFEICDVSSTNSIKESFSRVYKRFSKIDVLINNAFYAEGSEPLNISDEDFLYTMDGSLSSVYRCIREVAPFMVPKNYGRIINVSSMYGIVSPDFGVYENNERYLNPPHYGAAKAGVLQLTRYFACYLGKKNILVNAVTPGPFPSPNTQQEKSFIQNLQKKVPLGRIGHPDELKGIFVFLSSDASSFVTGQNFTVDGGWTAW